MTLQPDLKRLVAEGLNGTTIESPRTLTELIGYVDAREKLVISYDEVHDALKDLVEAGKALQVGDSYCAAAAASAAPKAFNGFSKEAYRKAVEAYQDRFWKTYEKLKKKR